MSEVLDGPTFDLHTERLGVIDTEIHSVSGDGLEAITFDAIKDELDAGGTNPIFDIDGSPGVTISDFNFYIDKFLYVNEGDVTLDRIVGAADLSAIGGNWQATGAHLGWGEGDLEDDDVVDAIDMNRVGDNWLEIQL